jgi:hypothetical protein
VEAQAGGFAPMGAMHALTTQEFKGSALVSIVAQQNLGDWLFRLPKIPFLTYSGMELMLIAGAVWTTASDTARALSPIPINTAKLPYIEAGFGVNRILTLLRLDFAWRLTHRRDAGNFEVTLTAALF